MRARSPASALAARRRADRGAAFLLNFIPPALAIGFIAALVAGII